ncbi:MAG: hypothetical protein VX214_06165, partial [Chloroflexota bacterium]|nr:hypothetical protein [Chloroflexota bacterium]
MNLSKIHLYSKNLDGGSRFEDIESGFEILAEQILEVGDVNEAMRNLVQEGFSGEDDRPVGGLNDIAKCSEEERRFLLEKYSTDQVQEENLRGELESYKFFGSEPLTSDTGREVLSRLHRLDNLDGSIKEAMRTGQLENVDLDDVEDLLGSVARIQLEEILRMINALEEAGYLLKNRDRFKLGPKAVREIAQDAMREIFSQMKKGNLGAHDTFKKGDWGDLTGQTIPYEFGQSFEINLQK